MDGKESQQVYNCSDPQCVVSNHRTSSVEKNRCSSSYFSIMADEYQTKSNWFYVSNGWITGLYQVPDIALATLVAVIKDTPLRMNVSLSNCRGQCYDGASNMAGRRESVAQQI